MNKTCIILFIASSLLSFDHRYYITSYPNLAKEGIKSVDKAIEHYLTIGKISGMIAVPNSIVPTNFDWQFYIQQNNLSLANEEQAIEHYQSIGHAQKLPSCKTFDIIILLHLFYLDLIDEFVQKINNFIKINNKNRYKIKINIPIDSQIFNFDKKVVVNAPDELLLREVQESTPYHRNLITQKNYKLLFTIKQYIIERLNIDAYDLEIIFSENKGLDVGGFFLLLDRIIKQNLKHDFIIKLHTKKNENWRKILTSFLNIPINTLLNYSQAIYSNRLYYNINSQIINDPFGYRIKEKEHLFTLFKLFKVPPQNFDFCAGTIFIASSKFTAFFSKFNRIDLFNLFKNEPYQPGGMLEHGFERFFGYLFKYLNLPTHILDYYPDNFFSQNVAATIDNSNTD